jgi:hypothetical protein
LTASPSALFSCRVPAALLLAALTGCNGPRPAGEVPRVSYPTPDSDEAYSFLVAGHAYGAHKGDNEGLHPGFLARLRDYVSRHEARPAFVVLAGDIVRHGRRVESWAAVAGELDALDLAAYYVMGNHDASEAATGLFRDRYGGTYYGFDRGTERFIVLDCMLERGSIAGDQLRFLDERMDVPDGVRNVFVFAHELIWAHGRDEFAWVRHNFGDYARAFETSNFWDEVFPVLSRNETLSVYFVGGDVGGSRHAGAAPAVLARKGNVTFVATGMGEVREENFLRVGVARDGRVRLDLIPLDPAAGTLALNDFTRD